MGVAVLMGATALAYYWGYNDMEKRHPVEGSCAALLRAV